MIEIPKPHVIAKLIMIDNNPMWSFEFIRGFFIPPYNCSWDNILHPPLRPGYTAYLKGNRIWIQKFPVRIEEFIYDDKQVPIMKKDKDGIWQHLTPTY